jgi:hypothetical protein
MTSNVAATVLTTVATVPVNNNNTTALAGDHTNADAELEQTTPSNAGDSSSKETVVGERDEGGDGKEIQPAAPKKSFRFFAIIAALALSGLLTSLEATITSTALPTITANLGGAELYIWVVNGFYLTQYVGRSALLPLPDLPFLF